MRLRFSLLLATALIGSAIVLPAQDRSILYQAVRSVPYAHDSGVLVNENGFASTVHTHLIAVPGLEDIRIIFAELDLGPNDVLTLTALHDGHSHALTATERAKWKNSGAWFNGAFVEMAIVLAPGSRARVRIDEVWSSGAGASVDTICGAVDDRIPSSDDRSMRFVSSPTSSGGGCTIWLASSNNCALTAGHCVAGSLAVAEMQVPQSTSGGTAQHPSPRFQFVVDDTGAPSAPANGVGDDFAMRRILPNAQGETAVQLAGGFFQLGFFRPSVGDPIRITGYGTDSGIENVSHQTHVGPAASATGDAVRYATDTTGGNSGSPVIDENTGFAVGIHTHGGCNATGGSNAGTSLTKAAFQSAWAAYCGTPMVPVAAINISSSAILAGGTVNFSDASTGIPTSWAWDLDGDGTTDSTVSNPSFTYTNVGTYDVTLVVTNALGGDSITLPGAVTVSALTPATLPVSFDFNAGLPAQGSTGWSFTSDVAEGRIVAGAGGNGPSPLSGGDAMIMDSTTSSTRAVNDASLVLDWASVLTANLSYQITGTQDENDPEDGLWLSDGTTEVQVVAHTNLPSTWQAITVDLVAEVAAFGLAPTSTLTITWRQADNFPHPTDGHVIDDISITGQTGTRFALTATTTGGGVGDLNVALNGLPAGSSQGYTLFSFATAMPVGQGLVFGIMPDRLTLDSFGSPLLPGNLFHYTIPGPAGAFPSAPFALPAGTLAAFRGMTADAVSFTLDASGGLGAVSNIARFTF